MRCIAKFAIAGLLLALPMPSGAQDNIRVRAGLSSLSGMVGLEVQNGSQAASLGWLPALGSNEDYYDGETKLRLAIGARYFLSGPDDSGLFVGSAFILNNTGHYEQYIDENFNLITGGIDESFNSINALVGYRKIFGERVDLTIGAGYGLNLGVSKRGEDAGVEKGELAIDFSIGFNIK